MESAESKEIGGNCEESLFYKDRIQIFFFTGGKTLLTKNKNKG